MTEKEKWKEGIKINLSVELGLVLALLLIPPLFVFGFIVYVESPQETFSWQLFVLQTLVLNNLLFIIIAISILAYIYLIWRKRIFALGLIPQMIMIACVALLLYFNSIEILDSAEHNNFKYHLVQGNTMGQYNLRIAACEANQCQNHLIFYCDFCRISDPAHPSRLDYDAETGYLQISVYQGDRTAWTRVLPQHLDRVLIEDFSTRLP